MMGVNLSPLGGAGAQFFDNSGYPLTGGKLYTYAAGTTTPVSTYQNSAGTTAHTNPIILDAAGRVPGGEIWTLNDVIYKMVLKTSTDTLIGTYDNLNARSDPYGSVVNLKDYFPTGFDTATTNCSPYIQQAIDAAGAVNGTLYIPAGTYYYTDLLYVSNSMTITGDGYGSHLKPYAPGGNNIRINASNVLVEQIRMEGSAAGGFAVGVSGLVTNVTFQNCFFKTVSQVIWLFTANDVTVQTCVFDSTGYGVIQQFGYVSNFVLVDNCIARNMGADFVEANCASTAPSESWVVSNNIFEGSANYPSGSTEQRFVGFTSVKNCVVTGNSVKNSAGDAPIHLEDTLGNTIISNNVFDNCVCTGGNSGYIYILTSSKNVIIEGNMFFRTNASLPLAYAIGTSSGSYTNDIQFSNNRVVGNGATGNFGGVQYSYQSGLLNCVGNIFESLTNAVEFGNGYNVLFASNYIYNCNGGIILDRTSSSDGGQNWLVANNVFQGTVGTYDIYALQNTNGTYAPQNWTINANVFSKQVLVQGLGGGTGYNAANDIAITNNVFNNGASLNVAGTMPRRVLFGNIFQDPSTKVTATAPDLPDYANDAAAATGGIPIGGMYRNGSVIQVRVS